MKRACNFGPAHDHLRHALRGYGQHAVIVGWGMRPHYDPFDAFVENGWLGLPASLAGLRDLVVAMAGASTLGCLRWVIGG
jgi:hypothetical protein